MTEKTTTLFEALAAAQTELGNAVFNRENTHFKSKYADLASVHDAIAPILGNHGIAYYQTDHTTEHGPVLRTTLVKGADSISSDTPVLVGDKTTPQAFFSARTYARRHGLSAIVGIASEDDDDGATAEKQGAVGKPGGSKNENWNGPLPKGRLEAGLEGYKQKVKAAGTMAELEAINDEVALKSEHVSKEWHEAGGPDLTFGKLLEQAREDLPHLVTGEGVKERHLFESFNDVMDAAIDRCGGNGGES